MEDLASKISELLSNPGALDQIKGLAGMLGGQGSQDEHPQQQPEPSPAAPNLGALGAALGGLGGGNGGGLDGLLGSLGGLGGLGGLGSAIGGAGNTGDMLQTVMKLAPLLQSMNQEDDSTRLLHALRPLLGEKRQKKLDEAVKILQLMRMLPLLKSSGILTSIL